MSRPNKIKTKILPLAIKFVQSQDNFLWTANSKMSALTEPTFYYPSQVQWTHPTSDLVFCLSSAVFSKGVTPIYHPLLTLTL